MLTGLVYVVGLGVWGAVLGSFLNVWVMRSIEGEDWVKGRSRCDWCKHPLAWYDNIPLLSYVWLRGRCRYCGKQISIQHPVMELLMASLFIWWGLIGKEFFKLVDWPWLQVVQAGFWLLIGIDLLVIVFTDLFYGVIPDVCVWLAGGLGASYRLLLWNQGVMQSEDLIKTVMVAVGAWLFFYGLYWLTKKRGMGLGDVYLAPVLGLILGWPRTVVGLMLAFLLGAGVGIGLMLLGKKKLKSSLPFAPFMVGGSFLALIWGYQWWQLLVS